jgi:ketosteroid isomerase-like protein
VAQASVATAEQVVRDTMKQIETAYATNDLPKYFSFFADDMTLWRGEMGRFFEPSPKAAYMQGQTDFVRDTGGYESCATNDLRVQVSPAADSAVTMYELACAIKNGQRVEYEMTMVLFNRAAQWKVVHFGWHIKRPAGGARGGRGGAATTPPPGR